MPLDPMTEQQTATTASHPRDANDNTLVECLEAWGPLIASGYECPAAGQRVIEAAERIKSLLAEVERLTVPDFDGGNFVAYKATAAVLTALRAQDAVPVAWECFRDAAYYDMWCVRPKGSRAFGEGFHLVNGEEAEALRELLSTRPTATNGDKDAVIARLVGEYRSTMDRDVLHSWAGDIVAALANRGEAV